MTCQECEIKLGMGEDAAGHLASCAECRALAEDLRLNSVALREMRVRPGMRWESVLAAAAIVLAIGLQKFSKTAEPETSPMRQRGVLSTTAITPSLRMGLENGPKKLVKHVRKKRPPAEPLRVKMFTSDPDVVIYWIVDKKEGIE